MFLVCGRRILRVRRDAGQRPHGLYTRQPSRPGCRQGNTVEIIVDDWDIVTTPVERFWKWNDLINRPERWPAEARLLRQVAFQSGTKFPAGSVVHVTKVSAREIEVLLPDGGLAGFGPDDTDLLDAANRSWAALTDDQRAVDYAMIARDASLHPATVTTHVNLNFPNVTIPAGSEVPFANIVSNKLHVWGKSCRESS